MTSFCLCSRTLLSAACPPMMSSTKMLPSSVFMAAFVSLKYFTTSALSINIGNQNSRLTLHRVNFCSCCPRPTRVTSSGCFFARGSFYDCLTVPACFHTMFWKSQSGLHCPSRGQQHIVLGCTVVLGWLQLLSNAHAQSAVQDICCGGGLRGSACSIRTLN